MTKHILFIISILMLFSACNNEELDKQGEYIFLRNEGADMPVWIRGNDSSNVFIIHLHGGPGGSSITEAQDRVFVSLETEYKMVYWDQRGSGASQGNAKPETMNMEQFVEDLNKLVILLKSKHENPRIFLMGHSWGGALGAAYLTTNNYQQNIRGWIEIDGAHNMKKGLELSREWTIHYADSAIKKNMQAAFWQEALQWYETHPILDTKDLVETHASNVKKANGYIFNPGNPNILYFKGGNILSPAGEVSSGDYAQKELFTKELTKGYSDEMYKITIPSLILWGKNDGILPVAMAEDAFAHLGTDSIDKYVTIFEKSAHYPNREEPLPFSIEVKNFIEKYK